MNRFSYADAASQFAEFRRLRKTKIEVLEKGDPEYLRQTWYFPIYHSFDLFIERYPTQDERAELIDRLQDSAVMLARESEQAELDVQRLFGRSIGHP